MTHRLEVGPHVCLGCRGVFFSAAQEFVAHPYIGASEGCWSVMLDAIQIDYQDSTFSLYHRLFVDAYGAQHPGNQVDRRARQSAFVHLRALYDYFENNLSFEEVRVRIGALTKKVQDFPVFPNLEVVDPGWMTVQVFVGISDSKNYNDRVLSWARSVLDVYKKQLPTSYWQTLASSLT